MYCPKCISKLEDNIITRTPLIRTKVIDSRLQSSQIVRRRRLCNTCGYGFTTWESVISMDSRESLLRIWKKRIDKIKEQAQEIVDKINKNEEE